MIRNGQIWQSPSKLLAILQELEADMWIVLGTPTPAFGGGTEMRPVEFPSMAITCQFNKFVSRHVFHTRGALEEHLKGWVYRKDLSLDWM